MTKYLLAAFAAIAMSLSTTACTTECDDAQDRIDAKIRACGGKVPTPTTDDTSECTDAEASSATKSADAFVAQTCDQVLAAASQ